MSTTQNRSRLQKLGRKVRKHAKGLWDDPVGQFLDRTVFQDRRPGLRAATLRLLARRDGFAAVKERNRYHIRRHLQKGHLELRSFPKLLHVEMSTYCNLRCRMCSIVRPSRDRAARHISWEVIDRLRPVLPFVSDTKMHGGGEPFLHPDIERIGAVFREYGVQLNTVTNATVIDDRIARFIGHHFATLTVSLDGATAATFEAIRERARFDRVMHSLDLLNQHRQPGFKLILGLVLLRANVHELPDLVRLAKEKGAQEVQAAWLVPFSDLPWTQEQDPTREPERVNRYLKETYAAGEELGISLKLPPMLPVRSHGSVAAKALAEHRPCYGALHPTSRVEGLCQLMYDRAMVLVDGTIKPCGQSESVPDLGSLANQSFEEIWSGPGYQRLRSTFRSGTLPKSCRSCNFIRSGQLGKARLIVRDEEGRVEPLLALDVPR